MNRPLVFVAQSALELSIYEFGQPPRFRFTATQQETLEMVTVETQREDGARQSFAFAPCSPYILCASGP